MPRHQLIFTIIKTIQENIPSTNKLNKAAEITLRVTQICDLSIEFNITVLRKLKGNSTQHRKEIQNSIDNFHKEI